MNTLHIKYKENKISPEELLLLREKVNLLPDNELEKILSDEWIYGPINDSYVSPEKLMRIKSEIDKNYSTGFPKKTTLKLLMRVSAAAIILLLLGSTLFLYRENNYLSDKEMVISTNKNESANLTLPDGTKVMLNAESTLKYTPQTYNKKERKLDFEGEGYFIVHRNTDIPFLIATNDMKLKVLGTKFNLLSRDQNQNIEVYLEEGHVMLYALRTQNEQELFATQKAYLDKKTGLFTVIKANQKEELAWRDKNMVFVNRPFIEVVKAIEENYKVGIRFVNNDTIFNNDFFSGTLPANDLIEALDIFRKSYHLKYVIINDTITFSSN